MDRSAPIAWPLYLVFPLVEVAVPSAGGLRSPAMLSAGIAISIISIPGIVFGLMVFLPTGLCLIAGAVVRPPRGGQWVAVLGVIALVALFVPGYFLLFPLSG